MDRAKIVHETFLRRVAERDFPEGMLPRSGLSHDQAKSAFEAACLSRALDIQSRKMQRDGQGFYTIGSSGHEGMSAVALAVRPSDPAFLHYRDAAFQIARAWQVPGQTPAMDILLSFAASADDPISGGRHKVLGSKALNIPPQTSTIASHLPKAVGAAYAIGAARRNPPQHQAYADDAIAICCFGDASVNHSAAQGAFNAAAWASYQSSPMPILFVCEDNGIGISTKTPHGWIRANFRDRPGFNYFSADGLDIFDTYAAASDASEFVRRHRKPAFLHLRTVRLYGHAGADVITSYLSPAEVEADEANDPLLHSVRLLYEAKILEPEECLSRYSDALDQVEKLARDAVQRPRLSTAADVMESIVPPPIKRGKAKAPKAEARTKAFGSDQRSFSEPQIMSRLINWALTDIMLEYPEVVIMGQDVGLKGGVYGATQKLIQRFGPDRVIDTLLDETSILGLAIGMSQNGFIPMPEIQFLAYLHNAEDQIRGEAATLSFFSNGQFANPMVLRIAGLGYQKGFGGHFHNDNSVAVLRDIPGVILACPSNGPDAVLMLRESVRLAREEQRVVVFLEPIALYGTRDLHGENDGLWKGLYPDTSKTAAFGEVALNGDGTDLAIISFANGYHLSRQAQSLLKSKGVAARVIDMRWLSPLPLDAIVDAIGQSDHVLIVDETRQTGGIASELAAELAERIDIPIGRHSAKDSFIATGPAYAATLPSCDSIVEAAVQITTPDA